MEAVADFLFLGSKITAYYDCNHKIKRRLLLGRKAMRNLDSIWKSRDITVPAKVCIVKATFFLVQFSSVAESCPGLQARQVSLCITNSLSLLKLMSIELGMPSNHLILCCPLLLLPSIFPSIRVFSNESALCIRWPKFRSFNFSISPSNEYLGLISFSID